MNRLYPILGFVVIGLIITCGCTAQTPPGPPATTPPSTFPPTPLTTATTPAPTTPVATPSPTVTATSLPTTQPTPSPGGTASVTIQNFAFVPGTLTITRGTTVTWVNQDSAPHTVVGDAFSSNTLSKGSAYSFTFGNAGTYRYHCGIHPSMTGTITVT
ncbi:MAG: cupredoxin domain-containing protein [Methanomicrobiales archaeon]|nr:cupredoxin domain-containing protein [Methanomicrobiales archaeon]